MLSVADCLVACNAKDDTARCSNVKDFAEEVGGLSEEERQQLMAEVGKITETMNTPIEIKK